MALAGLDDTTTNFAIHPDYRQVAAFALGWVFITSLRSIFSSTLVQRLLGFVRWRTSSSVGRLDLERLGHAEKASWASSDSGSSSDLRRGYMSTAYFALFLCFLFASIAQFASLLAFPTSSDAACAFVVAWGGMAAQSGRLVGALIVLSELRKMGIARWEFWVAIGWLIVGIAFIFLNNAVGVGVLTPFAPLGVAYCDRKHFLPASLVSSILYFSLEVYAVARMVLFLSGTAQMRMVMFDIRVLRPLALIFLELLTLVPSAVFTNTVAEFVPFSIGAYAVLFAFSHKQRHRPTVPRESVLSFETYPSVQPFREPPHMARPGPASSQMTAPTPTIRHAFSTSYQADGWESPRSARSTRTIETMGSHSIDQAVVSVSQRVPAASPAIIPVKSRAIVPSQIAFAERLDRDDAQANLQAERPRPTLTLPDVDNDGDDISDLISPASRTQRSHFRLSRLIEGSTRQASSRTSLSASSSADSVVRTSLPPVMRESSSLQRSSLTSHHSMAADSSSTHSGHRRSVSIPIPSRWPTFNGGQPRAAVLPTPKPPPLSYTEAPRGPRPAPPSVQGPRINF